MGFFLSGSGLGGSRLGVQAQGEADETQQEQTKAGGFHDIDGSLRV